MFERQSTRASFIAVTGYAIRVQHRCLSGLSCLAGFRLTLLRAGWTEGQCG
jgi:hypothetical protein